MKYAVVVTAVTDRADLFVVSMESLLAQVDVAPAMLIVSEDTRPGEPESATYAGAIFSWLQAAQAEGRIGGFVHRCQNPAWGMGPGVAWVLDKAAGIIARDPDFSPFVFFTQEDWEFLRPIPVRACIDLMTDHALFHVRFNKRKTMAAKHADTAHPWHKVEVAFSVPPAHVEEQVLCVSDHWYTQPSLWRVDRALATVQAAARAKPAAHSFVGEFNHRMNMERQDGRPLQDQMYRHEIMRTYIWGPIGERAFCQHLGSRRGTGPIKFHLKEPAPGEPAPGEPAPGEPTP
jgi:hypothetical protein